MACIKPSYLAACLLLTTGQITLVYGSSQSLFDMSLEQLVNIEVSIATHSQVKLSQTPSSVTVYTRQELNHMGVNTLEHLLNFVPGVQASRSQHDGLIITPVFRGRGNQNGTNPNILLMIDGRRLNSPVFGGAFDLPLNNLEWIKQIEIIRGTGSALYGANAFHGVINIITEINPTELKLRIGEHNLREAAVKINTDIGEANLAIYAHSYNDEGADYAPFYTFFNQKLATQDPYSRDTLATELAYKNIQFSSYSSKAEFKDFVQGSTFGNGTNAYRPRVDSYRIAYHGLKGEQWNLKLNYEHMRWRSDAFLTVMPAESAKDLWWSDGSEITAIGGNHLEWEYDLISIDGNYSGIKNHRLTFGGEVREEWVDRNPFHGNWEPNSMASSNGETILPCECISRGFWFQGQLADFLPQSDRSIHNIWMQDEWRLAKALSATFGSRYDYYDDVKGHFSFRGSLVYSPSEKTQFKIIAGDAFRAPTISETRALIASNFEGNPSLQPETVNTLDLVWQQSWNQISLNTTWSHSKISDVVVLVAEEDQNQPEVIPFKPINKNTLNLEDLEFELLGQLTRNVFLRAGLTHHIKYEHTGVAQNLAFLITNVSLGKTNVNFNTYYHDKILSRDAQKSEFDRDIYLDSFWNFGFKASTQVSNRLQIFLNIQNLFDENYRTYTTTNNGLEFGLPSRGRTTTAGLRWTL